MKNRDEYLIEFCTGKNVLHVGACDAPVENTKRRYENKELLFLKIEKVAKKQIGYDIDKEAIGYLKEQGHDNIFYNDMNEDIKTDQKYDVILYCDVIEHTMNLKTALESLKRNMSENTLLIITTPNFITAYRIIRELQGKSTNDLGAHNMIFSERTLEHLLKENNFEIITKKYTFLNHHKNKIDRLFSYFFPNFSSTLLFVCKKG